MDGAVTDGLSGAIVNMARQMRHDGIRLVVGTQSPRALAPELLELVTVAVIHRFHSKDWFSYLKDKIPLENAAWDRLLDLNPGKVLVFSSRHQIGGQDKRTEGR
jgi:DNA phosphorothioation-dependent restriction protein DptH